MRLKSIGAVIVASALIVGALAAISLIVPRPASGAEQTQIAKAARDAITTEGSVAQFEATWPKYGLSQDQRSQLRDKITRELRKVYTGDALTAKLRLALGWVDQAADGNAARVLEFRVDAFVVGSVTVQGDTATLTASYTCYFKHAQIGNDKEADEVWGAWASYDARFWLQRVGDAWLVSGLERRETEEREDTSLATTASAG